MRRRTLEVELDGVGSVIRGWGSRELFIDITGRAPFFVRGRRGWSCQEKTARDVMALAERRGYDVLVIGPRAQSIVKTATTKAPQEDKVDPGGSLW